MRPYNVEGFRAAARRRLPRAVFDFVDGGAQAEVTMRAEQSGFDALRLMPRVLVDVSEVDLTTTFCGQPLSMPVMLAPAGLMGMLHSDGELGAGRAAAGRGIVSFQSAAATYTIEEASAISPTPWYQLYPWGDRDAYGAQIDRARAAGMSGLCVTVDGVGAAMRERDVVNRLASPPTLTLRNAHDMLRRPRWLADVVRHRRTGVRMEPDSRGPRLRDMVGAGALMAERAQRFPVAPMTWDDLVWLRETWSGALAVKGVLDPEDARRAVATGADAIVVSSHGGRALDGVPTALEALPAVAAAVGDEADVILDGGVRRGTDVLKALCLGARACMVGRAWAYALGAAGEPGVSDMLDLLHAELLAGMRSLGRTSVDQLSPAVVRRAA